MQKINHKKNPQRTSGPVNAHLTPGPGIYFNAFIHVSSPRAGADNPLGTNVDVNRKTLSLRPFVASLKKKLLLSPIFYPFLCSFFHMYIAPGRGRQPTGDQNFITERPFLFARILQVKSDFIHIFNDFIHVYSPGARAENPLGTNF